MKKCKSCKKIVELDSAEFCPYCGSSALASAFVCSSCGCIVEEGYRFCAYCGEANEGGRKADRVGAGALLKEKLEISVKSWLPTSDENVYKDYTIRRKDSFSYCISADKPNDIRIIKTLTAEPDTLYVVSADIRCVGVVNVENKNNPLGASISIDGSISHTLLGTADWQTVRVIGKSGKNGELSLSLNLGYFSNTVLGTAWFENIRVERATDMAGYSDWHFLAVLLTNTGIDTFDGELNARLTLSHQMSDDEIATLRNSLVEFENTLTNDGEGLFGVSLDIIECSRLCDDYTRCECGYTVTAESAYAYLQNQGIDLSGYDHIFMISCLPGLPATYYGLGGLFIKGKVGFSFVLHRDVSHYLDYLNRKEGWEWPPAVYVHEFLHSIENYSASLGCALPSIHDGEQFGYTDREEWHGWYRDYIRKAVKQDGAHKGVEPLIWHLPPRLFN